MLHGVVWCLLVGAALGGNSSSSSEVVSVTVKSMHPEPILWVRVGECAFGATSCDEKSVLSWSLGRADRRGYSRLAEEDMYEVSYSVSFSMYHGGTRLLFMRVEYSSESEALRSHESAIGGGPSFVGSRIVNAWPLVVPAARGEAKSDGDVCARGESYEGEGRWTREVLVGRTPWLACLEDGEDSRKWRWIPDACQPSPTFGRDEAVSCLREGLSLTIMGDSILRFVTERLDCQFASSIFVRKWHVKGPMPRRLFEIEETLKQHEKNVSLGLSKPGGVLVLNVAGLWQAAYGDLDVYEESVERVVSIAMEFFDNVVMWLTTAVHPIHFLGLYDSVPDDDAELVSPASRLLLRRKKKRNMLTKKKAFDNRRFFKDAQTKRAMTQPRIRALVQAERRVAEKKHLEIFDASVSTAIREDDPLTSTDMRHFGPSTIAELTELLLNFVCSSHL